MINVPHNIKVGEMDFKVEGPWNTENYCLVPWLTRKVFEF